MTGRHLVYGQGWVAGYRDLYASDRPSARRIRAAVAALADDPAPPASTRLGGSSYYRLRLDDYRILYEVDDDTVRVWSLGRIS